MQEVRFTEGQHVKKGDVLAQIEPRLFQAALDQAKAKRSQDVATLGAAEKDLERSRTLVVRSVATQQTVDQQQARVDQLKAAVEADDAAIETAQTQLDFTAIRAPMPSSSSRTSTAMSRTGSRRWRRRSRDRARSRSRCSRSACRWPRCSSRCC